MITKNSFSFRWGVELPDTGHTNVPNFFFDHYAEIGVSRQEFLTILHLARYQYENPGAECTPSLETLAMQMGCTVRTLQRNLIRLEKRGLLVKGYRFGKTTVYDFSGFSKAILLAMAQGGITPDASVTTDASVTPDASVTSTHDKNVTTPLTKMSPEEETNKHTRTKGVGGQQQRKSSIQPLTPVSPPAKDDQGQDMVRLLTDLGVSGSVAQALAKKCDLDQVTGWIAYAHKKADSLHDPAAFVVSKLQAGDHPPKAKRAKTEEEKRAERHQRYLGGKFADLMQH